MDINSNTDEIIVFKKSGEGKNVIIFSPFIPFTNKFVEDFFILNKFENTQLIFSHITNSKKNNLKEFDLNNINKLYSNLLKSIGNDYKIILVGFGIFSVLFSKILNDFSKEVSFLILFEPDLSNSVLMKVFDIDKKSIIKYKTLLNFYLFNKKENNTNIYKKNLKYLKYFYYNIKEYLRENKILKDLVNHKSKIKIFWKVMEKESWPLAQILEEYEMQVFSLRKNIFDSFLEKEEIIFNEFKEILY